MKLWVVFIAALIVLPAGTRAQAQYLFWEDAPSFDASPEAGMRKIQLLSLTGATPNISDEAPAVEFALGLGYANLSIGNSDDEIHSEGLLRFEPVVAFAPFQAIPQIRIGAGLGIGLMFDNSSLRIISSGGVVIAGHANVPLTLWEPELRLSWRQYFDADRSFFVEPGVAVGIAYANLSFDTDTGESFDESDSTTTGRVFLNVGGRVGLGAAGLQASYMRGGSMHLADNVNGEVNEFYIGVFGSIRF
jgi:hypothetical protein